MTLQHGGIYLNKLEEITDLDRLCEAFKEVRSVSSWKTSTQRYEADVIVQLYGGARVTVTKIRTDGWSEVEYNGKKGYVKTEFLADSY